MSTLALAAMAAGVLLALSCKREERQFQVDPQSATPASQTTVTDFYAGGQPSESPQSVQHPMTQDENNAYALSEGKRLFDAYNCTGCHAHGGGGIGPALMDEKWIYGAKSEQIFATIVQGRPNGMPSFKGKIPEYQVWQLAAYVRSLSGLVSKNAAPARDDHMQYKQPENTVPTTSPKSTGTPKSSEMTQ